MEDQYKPQILRTIASVRRWRLDKIVSGKSVGFVPTMGALHEGHLSLINRSLAQNHCTIVSIFVNPSQFAPSEDLDKYPRTVEDDISLVSAAKGTFDALETRVDAIFIPDVNEIYPSGIPLEVSEQTGAFVTVLGLSEMLEGRTRPNFFRGVATVVSKFFILINPTRAYFGQKDYQQSLVIRRMVKDLLFDIEIVVCDIYRDPSGLALSSRNKYLDTATIEKSKTISAMLAHGKRLYDSGTRSSDVILDTIVKDLSKFGDSMEIDYVSINDKENLQELKQIGDKGAVLSCAIYVKNEEDGKVTRLIDNILL